VGLARKITGCALAAALAACGGSKDESTSSAADVVTLTIYGTATTYTDAAPNVAILATSTNAGANTLVTLGLTTGGLNVQLVLPPAGQTGSGLPGTVTSIVGGHSCGGPVTVSLTKNGSGLGAEVAGSFAPTAVPCATAPSPSTISASFSVTRIN
jgi:hypothetical protein